MVKIQKYSISFYGGGGGDDLVREFTKIFHFHRLEIRDGFKYLGF
jgi:hypothetical protein